MLAMKIWLNIISDGEQGLLGDRCSKHFRQNEMANTKSDHVRVC
jgi:hypothetical protein